MLQDSVGAGDAYSCEYNRGGKDCSMPQNSVGAEHADSCEYNQGGMDCYMPQVGAEDGGSCEYNQGGKDCYSTFPRTALMAKTAMGARKHRLR